MTSIGALGDAQVQCDYRLPWNKEESALAPFLVAARPWLQAAENRIWRALEEAEKKHPDSINRESLFLSARYALHGSILLWIGPAAVVELNLHRCQKRLHGENSTDRFHSFLDWLGSNAGSSDFFNTYPTLRRCIELRTWQSENFFIEIARNFLKDRTLLASALYDGERLPPLDKITLGKGDRHAHGRTVAILELSGGQELVYKPRSLALEVTFANLIRWINDRGIGPDQRAGFSLPRDGYGYMEYIACDEISSTMEATRFYERLGGMIAICYLLSATDMHYENFVANGEYPVLVDLETLLHPTLATEERRAPQNDSILRCGFVPSWEKYYQDKRLDVWGLASRPETVQARVPAHASSDRLSFVEQAVKLPQWSNLPLMNGQPASPVGCSDAIVDGFESTYSGLMKSYSLLTASGSPLRDFKGLGGRAILRNTDAYCSLLRAFSHPDTLQSPLEYERLLEKLHPVSKKFPGADDILCSEKAALRRYDIPRFRIYTDETMVRDEEDKPLCRAFQKSGYEEMMSCLRRLGPADLERQSRLLSQTLAGMRSPESRKLWPQQPYIQKGDGSAVQSGDLVALACRLANRIAAAGLPNDADTVYLQLHPSAHRLVVPTPLDWGLYKGLSGVALFMAQIGHVAGQSRFKTIAESMVKQAREQALQEAKSSRLEVGAFSGLAGWSYVLFYLGTLWNNTKLIKESLDWLPAIAEYVEDDHQIDLIGGAAGALWVCLKVYQAIEDKRALAVARQCADHLIRNAVNTGRGLGWTSTAYPDFPISGFAHGASGAAIGLAWLGELTDTERYKANARAALAYEYTTFDEANETFADLRQDRQTADGQPGQIYAWCHGAPGMGMARLCLPESFRDHQWYRVVNAALKATFNQGLGGSHCLCHGDLGNLDFLLQAEQLEVSDIEQLAWRSLIPQLIERVKALPRCGTFREAEPIDLMTGLAGIGYGLLRLAMPARIPSVLTLDFPHSGSMESSGTGTMARRYR